MLGFWKKRKPAETLWLVKDDPDGQWWCKCPQGIADTTHHREDVYPTGGNGWLFTCVKCGYAFMFARAVRIRLSLQDIGERCAPRTREIVRPGEGTVEETTLATAEDWLALALPIQADLVEGQRYAFFDGRVFPTVHGPVQFRGIWRSHDLPDLPHIAEGDAGEILSDPEYWTAEMDDE